MHPLPSKSCYTNDALKVAALWLMMHPCAGTGLLV